MTLPFLLPPSASCIDPGSFASIPSLCAEGTGPQGQGGTSCCSHRHPSPCLSSPEMQISASFFPSCSKGQPVELQEIGHFKPTFTFLYTQSCIKSGKNESQVIAAGKKRSWLIPLESGWQCRHPRQLSSTRAPPLMIKQALSPAQSPAKPGQCPNQPRPLSTALHSITETSELFIPVLLLFFHLLISAIAEFIVVIPALWLQNSPRAALNQLPLHREGGKQSRTTLPRRKCI